MKKMKTLITMFAAAAAMILLPASTSLKASAEAPNTFYIEYDSDGSSWYVLTQGEDENTPDTVPKVLGFFYNEVKEGDYVVITNRNAETELLDLGSTRLGNVTITTGSAFTMVKAAGITDFYALANSSCSITAPITNAYVYDPAVANFNNDVQNLFVVATDSDFSSDIGCAGTVGTMKMTDINGNNYSLYNFTSGSFGIVNGLVSSPEGSYSLTPSSTPAQTPAPAPSKPASSGEYDQVPKTGEANTAAWLLCAAALFMAASCGIRKISR